MRKPPATRHDPVDLLVGPDPLAEHPQRLEGERAGAAVGDEADRVAGADRRAAHRLGHRGGGVERVLRALVAGDDLDQLHPGRRVEEVHADDPRRGSRPRGDRGDRERGGVGGEHGVGAADRLELGEQLALQVEALGRGLDHEGAAGEALELGRRGDVLAGALDALRKGVAVGIVHDDLDPGAGRELRDPRAHRPGADDSRRARPSSAAPPTARGSPGGASRGRPASPRRGPRSPSRRRRGAARPRPRR